LELEQQQQQQQEKKKYAEKASENESWEDIPGRLETLKTFKVIPS